MLQTLFLEVPVRHILSMSGLPFVAAALLYTAPGSVLAESEQYFVLRQGAPAWMGSETSAPAQSSGRRGTPDEVMAARLSRVMALTIQGPQLSTNDGALAPAFPAGTVFDGAAVADGHAIIRVSLPRAIADKGFSDSELDIYAEMTSALPGVVPGVKSISLQGRTGTGGYRPLSELRSPVTAKARKPEAAPGVDAETAAVRAGQPPAPGQPQPSGALAGASIFLSPGHGWYYTSTLGRWATQRGNTNQMIEDHSNVEMVCQFLCQYLWNAGARVYVCRERDLNTNSVIVDCPAASYSGSWTAETLTGTYNGTQRWAATVTGAATATATFTPVIPAAGYYSVWAWYRTSGAGTTTANARMTINHTGGATTWVQDENHDGYTWKYIGTYYFNAGSSPGSGSVVVDNQSATAGNRVTVSAVRFGGGMGTVRDNVSNTLSGKPRFEESGRYYAAFMGKSDWATENEVSGMPTYAAWECESWEAGKAVYVSWHSNAFDGASRGTTSFAYASAGWDGTFNGVAGGDVLRNTIHNELINDIRAGWDGSWANDGLHTNWYGELNPNNNNKMPAALMEMAFHDNATDAAALLNPNFRMLLARAVYQGIAKYYRNNVAGFTISTLLPEPPTSLRVTNNGSGAVDVAWNAPPYNSGNGLLGDAAASYRLYRSTDGKGFDNGTPVSGTSTVITGLTAGQVYYFRVAAVNAGGESFPTETLAVKVRSAGTPPVLVVNGFDRIDGSMNVVQDDPDSASPLQRGFLSRMNTYDYIIPHAQAISAAGRDFDSCSNEAVIAGQVNLTDYKAVVWILGEESSADHTFDATEQTKATAFLAGGGGLFVSGSEIGYELDGLNLGRTFFNNYLHASYASDSSGSHAANGASGSIFNGTSLLYDDGTFAYDVDSADVVNPTAGGVTALTYGSASASVSSFDVAGGWQDPNYSGSTRAEPTCTFSIVSSPVHGGSGAGDLYYDWGTTGTFIREYNSTLPQFPLNSSFSIWVYGDNSGNQVRVALRDPVDGELFVNPYTTINFTGWQQITWANIQTNQGSKWAGTGDGVFSGTNVQTDSIQINHTGAPVTGHLYFDDAVYTSSGSAGNAGVQYNGAHRVVYLAFPFETITNSTTRNSMMSAILEFLGPRSGITDWSFYY